MKRKESGKRKQASQSEGEHPLERSAFGRAVLSTLREGLPKELYEKELAALRDLYVLRAKTSKINSPRSGGPGPSRRPVSPRFADRSPFERGLFRRLQEGLPPDEFETFLKEWDATRRKRAKRRGSRATVEGGRPRRRGRNP